MAFVALEPLVFWPGAYDSFAMPKQVLLLVTATTGLSLLAWQGADPLPRSRLVRWSLLGLYVSSLLSFLLAEDRTTAFLGYYQYRHGLVSQLSYFVLFLISYQAVRRHGFGTIAWAGVAASVSVAGYTLVQAAGGDPFAWWIDTASHPFSTLGNTGELASFVVLAFAFGTVLHPNRGHWLRAAGLVIFSAALTFTLTASGSRSGMLAVVPMIVAFMFGAWRVRWAPRTFLWSAMRICVGMLAGVVLAVSLGGAGNRLTTMGDAFPDGAFAGSSSVATRLALWHGAALAVRDAPFFGHGPDLLFLAFDRARPSDLGGIYREHDLVAQSSHDWFLDHAANHGIVGLTFLALFLGSILTASLRTAGKTPAGADLPYLWAGLAGYLFIVSLNHLSVAPHALFFALLGAVLAISEPTFDDQRHEPARLSPALMASRVVAMGSLSASLVLAVTLGLADRQAKLGWDAVVDHRFDVSANRYEAAARMMPLERAYVVGEARASLYGGTCKGDFAMLRRADDAWRQLDDRFRPSANDFLMRAITHLVMGEAVAVVRTDLAMAREQNPGSPVLRDVSRKVLDAARTGSDAVYVDNQGSRGVSVLSRDRAAGGCQPHGHRAAQPAASDP